MEMHDWYIFPLKSFLSASFSVYISFFPVYFNSKILHSICQFLQSVLLYRYHLFQPVLEIFFCILILKSILELWNLFLNIFFMFCIFILKSSLESCNLFLKKYFLHSDLEAYSWTFLFLYILRSSFSMMNDKTTEHTPIIHVQTENSGFTTSVILTETNYDVWS